MSEYSDYLLIQTNNRAAFIRNYDADIKVFQGLLTALRSAWGRLGTTRDTSGRSHAGLLPFSNILVRHSILGFESLASYQSFLTWLTFRPGLEALLIIGNFVVDPANAAIWKNRQTDFRAYNKAFSGSALESQSLPRSADFRSVLTRLNDEFMHPNPYFTYRDATAATDSTGAMVEIQFFDQSTDVHEGHVLAYINLIDLVTAASESLVDNLCGPVAGISSPREEYSKAASVRASELAVRNNVAKKVVVELGLWTL